MNVNFLYPSQFNVNQFITPPPPPGLGQWENSRTITQALRIAAVAACVATANFAGFVPPPPPPVQGAFADQFSRLVVAKPSLLYDFQQMWKLPPIALTANEPWGWITQWPSPPLRNTSIHADFTFKGFGDSFSPFKYDFFYTGISRGEIALTGVLTKEEIEQIKARDRARQEAWEIDDAAKVKLREQIQASVDQAFGRNKAAEPPAIAGPPPAIPPREETEDEYMMRMLANMQHLQQQFHQSIIMQVLREMRQREIDEEDDMQRLLLES